MKKMYHEHLRVGWFALLLTILATALPGGIHAENWVGQPGNFTIRQEAEGVLRFELPVYDQEGSDTWITSGKIFFEGPGVSKSQFIEWYAHNYNNDIPSGQKYTNTRVNLQVDGTATVIRSENSSYPDSDIELNKGAENYFNTWRYAQTEHMVLVLNWKVPLELRGKTLTFSFDVKGKGNGNYQNIYTINVPQKTIDMMAAPTVMKPMVTQAMVMEDAEYQGYLVVPWMIPVDSSKVTKVWYKYKNGNGNYRTQDLETNSSGFAKLYPDDAYREFQIICDYIDTEGNQMTGIASDPEDISMIHRAEDFKAKAKNDAKATVNISWNVKETEYEDFMEGDVFQIQRSMTGRDEDFVDLGFEMYEQGKGQYAYVDSTLVEALRTYNIDQATGKVDVSYRIRRGVSSLWGWEWGRAYNPTVAKASLEGQRPIKLMEVSDASTNWVSKDDHTIYVKWQYVSNDKYDLVWDDRAEFELSVLMYNRDNELVDSIIYDISDSEKAAKRINLTLPRSCVTYKLFFHTKKGQSPIPYEGFVPVASAEDWEVVAKRVLNGEKAVKVSLVSNIQLPENFTPLGKDFYTPFEGTINGNGFTITIDAQKPLITYANNITVQNLIIDGRFTCMRGSALAKEIYNSEIKNCVVKVDFTNENPFFSSTYEPSSLSVFSMESYDVKYSNCLFTGKIPDVYYWYGFDAKPNSKTSFHSCVNAPEECNAGPSNFDFYQYGSVYNLTMENCFYSSTSQMNHQDASELPENVNVLLSFLGKDWMECAEQPGVKPIMTLSRNMDGTSYEVFNWDNDKFYFESSGKVLKNSLVAQTRHSSVYLTWDTDGGPIDYFQVMRREKNSKSWTIVEPNLAEMSYEDTSVSPIIDYIYKVRSAVDCEGTHYEETDSVPGACKHVGKVEGYLRYMDGTAVSEMEVIVQRGGQTVAHTYTDINGHYVIDDIPYDGQPSITYTIAPISNPQIHGSVTFEKGSYQVTFNEKSNYTEVPDFVVTSGVTFSGYVFYEGTKIPVRGVNFIVNNRQVGTASGTSLETDHDGKFSFYVPTGINLEIRPVMAGHKFEDTQVYNHLFTQKVDEYFFYDDTKVKLIGRMVGGMDQGGLPLDNSLSRNNLGDNLTMTLALEGDNGSQLVYDVLNPSKSERDTVFVHNSHDGKTYKTSMHTTRRQITIHPDQTTGEYVAYLPPVKWKVQHLSCSGYSTLFPEGKISDVIDLTDALNKDTVIVEGDFPILSGKEIIHDPMVVYNAIYNCIYHTPTLLTYKQMGMDNFGYLGDLNYVARNMSGDKVTVPLVYQVETHPNNPNDTTVVMQTKYTFGYPVFSIEKKYPFRIAAVEKYYWNNNLSSDTVDVVRLSGGKVTIHNGMVSSTHNETVELDSIGQAIVKIGAEKIPYLLTQKDALRTVNMTLERDGTIYEAEPLRAYVFNIYPMKNGTDILSVNQPVLVDILRDPPGSGSSAKLSKGSTLKYSYSMDMNWAAGLEFSIKKGTALASFYGAVAAPMGAGVTSGVNTGAETSFEVGINLVFSGSGKRAFEYSMTATEDISTNSSGDVVGADGDVYIGVEQNIVVKPAYTIRAIPDSHFKQMGGQLAANRMVEIAQGTDENDSIYHLVRDESLTYGPTIKSSFHHSQLYIISTLIPELVNQCKSLMFTGTMAEAKAQADYTGKPVYLALVSPDDEEHFGVMNKKNGQYYRYTSTMPDEEGMNYRIVMPSGAKPEELVDEVQQYCASLQSWIGMIAQNEGEKLSATELVSNYVVDGGVGDVNYEEEYSSEYSCMNSMVWPVSGLTDEYFDSTGANTALTIVQVVGPVVAKFLGSILSTSTGGLNSGSEVGAKVEFIGALFEFGLVPALSYEVKPEWETTNSYSRKESFSISMDLKSHLSVDVYRVKNEPPKDLANGALDVCTSDNFYDQVEYNEDYLKRHLDMDDLRYSRGFVYRTRGGATCRPWEDERRTLFYQPGQILDEATKKIENPGIKLDKQSISGVPHNEPARFKIYLTNETQQPENTYDYYHLYMEEATNPKGAKLMVDGMPLTGTGRVVKVLPGEVTEKVLEVYAGEDFDYENIVIGLSSTEGEKFADSEASFDVHYLREAGYVNISTPGDKWILNTDAQYDEKFGYFLPVVIDGFDKHQKNFDHIEFQYKETTRGDEYWTNLCSYYASDSLFVLANGVKEMIPENGHITTQFFGEKIVMEKAYDLRAVLFCRNGNSFLTSSSKVLSGIKDTRRPQIFGTPEPKDGVIDIGDDIVFNFSEDIEYNYLNTANFEVKGEVNNNYLTEDVSIRFDNKASLETSARRNFNAKDITLEVMIKPDDTGKDMPIFSHGTNGKKLQLWYTKEHQLRAVVDDKVFTTAATLTPNVFTPVALVLRHLTESKEDSCQIELYNGGTRLLLEKLEEPYTSTSTLVFGRTNEVDRNTSKFYQGNMMEARLWYRALSQDQLSNTYGNKRLTGYELGLIDYYPMNDGSGNYATDLAQGAHATLYDASWMVPRGMSLHIDFEDKGIPLSENFINRNEFEDYTLMFWFRTDAEGRGVLISNGSGEAEDNGAKDQFYIGFDAEKLNFKSNGLVVNVPGEYSDNQWHHYAMTVNRGLNMVKILVDNTLRATFTADQLGGISGGHPMLGSAVYARMVDSTLVVADTRNYFRGYLDEICVFQQALPETLIKSYSSKSPYGDEIGLDTYLCFNRQERNTNNQIVTTPYPYSSKIYKDQNGNVIYQLDEATGQPTNIPQRDFPFGNGVTPEMIVAHIDQDISAPVRPFEELTNISYSYVGKGNQIFFNINETDERINKRNIYITVREIPDKNGNAMASPATAYYYVDCNPLRWGQQYTENHIEKGDEGWFIVDVVNNSPVRHTYHIENCPRWMKFDKQTDVIGPRQTIMLEATISKNLNVGTYDEVIYLVDENGLSEPLGVTIVVEGEEPLWYVDKSLRQYTMNIIGQVTINNFIDVDKKDIIGVFDDNGVCHGVANIGNGDDEFLVYINVFNDTSENKDLHFRLWHSATGNMLLLHTDEPIQFKASGLVGSVTNPIILKGGTEFVQTINLQQGWNWVSFNVYGERFFDINKLLSHFPWEEDDILTDNNSTAAFVFHNGEWMASDDVKNFKLMPQNSYAIKVGNDLTLTIEGTIIRQRDDRTIVLHNGWNGIGYTPLMNLTVQTALDEYSTNFAQDGDIIKSHDEFAVFSKPSNSSKGTWKGSLQYMMPGEGYMLLRNGEGYAAFAYPFFEPGSTFLDEVGTNAPARPVQARKATTMSVSAVTSGLDLMPGDQLLAFAEGELRGAVTAAEDNVFYISIEGDVQQPLSFAIEREGDIIAVTPEILTYKANAVVGTPDAPTKIDFTVRDIPKFGWYTLDGYKLQGRPTKKGVYIYNGKKYVID
ncbi:MAG: hypothetical protein J5548_10420 [Prevotella sp.]|nr:hypothetical protein [Prevotella sp.]